MPRRTPTLGSDISDTCYCFHILQIENTSSQINSPTINLLKIINHRLTQVMSEILTTSMLNEIFFDIYVHKLTAYMTLSTTSINLKACVFATQSLD